MKQALKNIHRNEICTLYIRDFDGRPFIFLFVLIFQSFSIVKISFLILLLSLSVYNGVISRGKACAGCKMRSICPGSAAR